MEEIGCLSIQVLEVGSSLKSREGGASFDEWESDEPTPRRTIETINAELQLRAVVSLRIKSQGQAGIWEKDWNAMQCSKSVTCFCFTPPKQTKRNPAPAPIRQDRCKNNALSFALTMRKEP